MSNNVLLKNALQEILTFLRHKAEDKGLQPVITVAKLTSMLHIAGVKVTYHLLSELVQDPDIAPMVQSLNKNQIVLNLGDEEVEPSNDENLEGIPPAAPPPGLADISAIPPADPTASVPPTDAVDQQPLQPPPPPKPSVVAQMARRAAHRN